MPNLDVIAGYTLANTRNVSSPSTQGQAYDGETPQHLFKIWSTYRFTQGPLEGFTLGGGAYFQSSTYRTTSYVQGGYTVFSAKLGYQFNRYLSADLSFDNLFDKQYFARAPYTIYSEYGAPRSVMLTLRATY
ncbi:TonB-dependent receptor domain-containing protein [Chitinasiproducens palmae]|uniref:Outer-membrane receptor for ferric coprogen and ferric-rhodotorulic acid n=1 Tax=Chitinasiproducens palmae TaxID=1770053 RepID=A0A1H2PQ20_9BURK|nr:TonB-dependent receptor [Chitinasiproducens palmae]SDV48883.1 outer-membrane receptor for ferric coprogen and ferric-rhodotorulic acid [Chitinasiproducens palmae]